MKKKYYQDPRYAGTIISVFVILGLMSGGILLIPLIFYIPYYLRSYIEITDKGVKVVKGIIIMSEQYLLYNKINNVELKRSIISFASINFYVGKDLPIKFKNISNGKEIRDIVSKNMEK